ncbi:putative reverse transcriptase domain-containing protein [Tanacetum coccineum]
MKRTVPGEDETVFRISNCTVENQVKFATYTLMGTALTWWNSHARTVTNDVAYAMTWTDLKKKMTTKYCPRNEIKKIEAELWNLKVKGTDVVAYNQRFQELALHPKTMQTIEMATELMDRKNNTFAERQAENKWKFEDTPRNNQNHQPNKRQNTGRAYAAGNGDKKPYEGDIPPPPMFPSHFKKDCPQWKNKNQGNGNAVARAYAGDVALAKPRQQRCDGSSTWELSSIRQEERWIVTDVHRVSGTNKLTVKNRYPLPRIDDLFDQLQGSSESYSRGRKNRPKFSQDRIRLKNGPSPKTPDGIRQFLVLLKHGNQNNKSEDVGGMLIEKAKIPDALRTEAEVGEVQLTGLEIVQETTEKIIQFVEEPIEITDREVKRLKRSRIPLVKVRWNSKRGPEFTWEREDQFRKKYPHLFTKTAPSSSAV